MTTREEDAVVRRAGREARRAASIDGKRRQTQQDSRAARGAAAPIVSRSAVRHAATAAAVGAAVGAARAFAAGRRRAAVGQIDGHGRNRGSVAPASDRTQLEIASERTAVERVLARGIDIAGEITIRLRNIELVTVELRLPIAAANNSREITRKE